MENENSIRISHNASCTRSGDALWLMNILSHAHTPRYTKAGTSVLTVRQDSQQNWWVQHLTTKKLSIAKDFSVGTQLI